MGCEPIVIVDRAMRVTTDDLVSWLPNTRLAIISVDVARPKTLTVEWASPQQLEMFPDLKGRSCYEWTKGFSAPCEGCPCLAALADNQIHHALVPSPRATRHAPTADIAWTNGELTYAFLVAIPIDAGRDGRQRVLEISLDSTVQAQSEFRRAAQVYELAASLSRLLESIANHKTADEFVLFGAVAEGGLAFPRATLLAIEADTGASDVSSPVGYGLSLERDRRTSSELQRVEKALLSRQGPRDAPLLRGYLLPLLRKWTWNPPLDLFQALGEQGVAHPERLAPNMHIPRAIRVTSRSAVMPILGYASRLHGVLVVEARKDSLITEDDLMRLSIFALFVHNAYSGRDIKNAYDTGVHRLQELIETYGRGAVEDLIISGAIVSGLGHDLRNSHRNLGDFARMLIGEIPASKRQMPAIEATVRQFESLLEFQGACLTRILQPHRVADPWFAPHDPRELLADLKRSMAHLLQQEAIELVLVDKSRVKGRAIECDEFLVRQLFTNLIDNSLHWMTNPTQRKIEISFEFVDEDRVEIEYKDSGVGIPPEISDQIWQPFFTLKAKGTGLGLTIVQRIVESHQGTIALFYRAGWGACFRIVLPVNQRKRGR